MDDLPTWAICSIVTASVVIGSVFAFLFSLIVALFLRWLTGVREPPALVIVAAGEIANYFCRRLFLRAPSSAPKLVHSESGVVVLPRSSPPIQS
jgi:hypothetical protein